MYSLKMITPFWFTRSLLLILLSLPSFIYGQSESGRLDDITGSIYDMNGNRLYYLVNKDKKQADHNGIIYLHNREDDFISSTGETYYYDSELKQIIHNGKVLFERDFGKFSIENKLKGWHYKWVEHQNVDSKRITKSKNAERIYYNDEPGVKTPEQGDNTLLTFSKGTYYDEFGNPLYTLKGRIPEWAIIVMFHNYYQENYTGMRLDRVLALRDSISNAFKTKKTLVMDMINLGNKYKKEQRYFAYYKIVYFTMIDKNPELLSEEQIKNIRNEMFIINKIDFHISYPPHL